MSRRARRETSQTIPCMPVPMAEIMTDMRPESRPSVTENAKSK